MRNCAYLRVEADHENPMGSEIKLFTDAALTVLNSQAYDPAAKSFYEIMSGGLMWPDEFPKVGTSEWQVVSHDYLYRYLIAYRAALTLGEEPSSPWPVWEQLMRFAPSWPGLREDRRGQRAKHRLLAARRRQDKCLDELDQHLRQGAL